MKKRLLIICVSLLLPSSGIFANCDFSNSTFEQERNESYFWACKEWIISDYNITNAKMDKELTRIEMARMLNIFSMEIIWNEEDPSKNCNWYSDLTNSNDIYTAKRSCHLWIMWIWIDNFRPNDSVSRAEFGTVLSRILYWDKYNVTEWEYYKLHLQALKDNWIITNDNPNIKEMKWYVLLMLKRYIDNKNKEDIEPEVLLKTDGWHILKYWTDITLSNNNDSITLSTQLTSVSNKDLAKWYAQWPDLQGPCAPGYHVPSKTEAQKLIFIRYDIRENDLYYTSKEDWRIKQDTDSKDNYDEFRKNEKLLMADTFVKDLFWAEIRKWCNSYLTRSNESLIAQSYFPGKLGVFQQLCWWYEPNWFSQIICFKTE